MKNIPLIFLGLVLTFSIFSCHKHEDEATTANITLMEPGENDTIAFGSEIHVEGTVSGDGELHGYTIGIVNTADNSSVFSVNSSSHASSYAFHEHWMNNVTDTVNMRVTVDVMLTHDGQKTSKSVNVVCLPQ